MKEALRRIVAYLQPEKVYLIGSMARGDARPYSDIDELSESHVVVLNVLHGAQRWP